MPLDPTIVAARVAELVGVGSADPDVAVAVAAAEILVVHAEGLEPRPDPSTSALPDDALTVEGMIGLSKRLYLDAVSNGGTSTVVADYTPDVVFSPEDPYRHYRHYFAPLAATWGVA